MTWILFPSDVNLVGKWGRDGSGWSRFQLKLNGMDFMVVLPGIEKLQVVIERCGKRTPY